MLNDQLVNRISARYGIKAKQTKQIGPVVKLVASNETYALKQYNSPNGLAFQVAATEHLKERRFHNCQTFFRSKNQETIIELDGKWYLLSKWISGKSPNVKQWTELRAMVQELARFHQAAIGLEFQEQMISAEELSSKTNWQKLPIGLEEKLLQLEAWFRNYSHPGLDKAVYLAHKSLQKLQSDPCPELAQKERDAKTFVHGDYNFPNVVLTDDKKVTLIDLDNSSYHVRIADLMHVIQRNMGTSVDLACRMMREYNRIRPLQPAEFDVLTSAISFPAQFWRMIHLARYKGKEPSAEKLNHWSRLYLSSRAASQIRKLRMNDILH